MKRNDRIISSQKTLRPTTGKVREALFNILRDRISGARFLDLYAGTGVIGIEALKQGATEAVLVETSKSSVKSIHDAISKNRFSDRAHVIGQKAVSYIEWAGANQLTFDIIFLDPPYHSDEIMLLLSAIDNTPVLKEGGVVIAEHFAKKALPEEFDNLRKVKDYKYGDSVLSIYEPG
jgi:16S rRNA (guanine(966)-N(2))-methyltransferase RsmD